MIICQRSLHYFTSYILMLDGKNDYANINIFHVVWIYDLMVSFQIAATRCWRKLTKIVVLCNSRYVEFVWQNLFWYNAHFDKIFLIWNWFFLIDWRQFCCESEIYIPMSKFKRVSLGNKNHCGTFYENNFEKQFQGVFVRLWKYPFETLENNDSHMIFKKCLQHKHMVAVCWLMVVMTTL